MERLIFTTRFTVIVSIVILLFGCGGDDEDDFDRLDRDIDSLESDIDSIKGDLEQINSAITTLTNSIKNPVLTGDRPETPVKTEVVAPDFPIRNPVVPDTGGIVGSLIAFSKRADDAENLFVIDEHGGFITQITFSDRDCMEPAWSPVEDKLAYYSSPDANAGGIYTMSLDGVHQSRLFLDQSIHDIGNPSWSPDGRRIVFHTHHGIVVMDSNGRNSILIRRGGMHPDWSPDGRRIAFVGGHGNDDDIMTMSPRGDAQKLLTGHSIGSDERPDWSPDSRQIAFQSHRDGQWAVCVIDADGQNDIVLTPQFDSRKPTWSSDGTKIAFTSEGDIFTMNADGTNVVNITNTPDVGENYPEWR